MAKTTSSLDLNLVRLNRRKRLPLTTQLYDSLRQAIQTGQLPRGFRLPSTRELALQLSVSRTTVINAFDQLVAEGYLTSAVGQGTHVNVRLPDETLRVSPPKRWKPSMTEVASSVGIENQLSSLGRELTNIDASSLVFINEIRPFRAGLPALDEFPVSLWSKLVRKIWREASVQDLSYGNPEGFRPLRRAIAGYVRAFRGVCCTDDQVMIINGTQQAFDIVTRLILRSGDKILFESPGYQRARLALQAAGLQLIHVPVDRDGMDVGYAIKTASDAKLAYVTPSHQFPLGVTMAIERRMQLVDWANRNQGWIFEDDYDSEYRYAHRPIPAMQGLDSGERTIYVGSFSKVMFPSLSIGYVVVPQALVVQFRNALSLVGRPPSKVDQIVLSEFIEQGHFARHLRRMRTVHETRRSALVEGLKEHLGHSLKIIGADAGLHCTAILEPTWEDVTVSRDAAERGVDIKPLSTFFVGHKKSEMSNGLIFGFACSSPAQIRGAIRKIVPVFDR